jgi:hypothetical protein
MVGTASARSGRRRSDSGANKRAPMQFFIFPELSKPAQTWKLKIDALPCSKNSQFLYVARLGYYEQFSKLCRHPILNEIRVKNRGTDSTFEYLMNFTGDLNLLEKSDKFSKIPS